MIIEAFGEIPSDSGFQRLLKYKIVVQYKSRIDALHTCHIILFNKTLKLKGCPETRPGPFGFKTISSSQLNIFEAL